MWREAKREREKWVEHSENIALLSMREDPRDAGKSILHLCWREQEGEPEIPFICASMAATLVKETMEYTDDHRRLLWLEIEKLLRYEERESEVAWDERMLKSYLSIRSVL